MGRLATRIVFLGTILKSYSRFNRVLSYSVKLIVIINMLVKLEDINLKINNDNVIAVVVICVIAVIGVNTALVLLP